MNIIDRTKKLCFSDITVGDVFEFEGIYYMKIEGEEENTSVGLECGGVWHFDPKEPVRLVRGSFVIE